MKTGQLFIVLILAGLLAACQFPQPISGGAGSPSPPMPAGSSSPSGAPSPPGMPTPSGSSSPSGSEGSPPSGSSPGGGDSSADPTSGEPLPWPSGEEGGPAGGGDSLESLDEQLDDALGDFDETMGQGGGASEDEIDILTPMGSGSSGSQNDPPLFEEGGLGEDGGTVEDEGIAQRAAGGAPADESGPSEGGQQGGASSSGGGGGSSPVDGQQGGNSTMGEDQEGNTDIIPIPDDVGDGRNDDIVLRQIREAAMEEKDPVLREKLWDEYRRIRDQ